MSHDQLINKEFRVNILLSATPLLATFGRFTAAGSREAPEMSRYRVFRCRQRYRLWECGLINKSDGESTYSNHIHESRLACGERKEISAVLAQRCLRRALPEYCSPTKVSSISANKRKFGVKVLIRKVRRLRGPAVSPSFQNKALNQSRILLMMANMTLPLLEAPDVHKNDVFPKVNQKTKFVTVKPFNSCFDEVARPAQLL